VDPPVVHRANATILRRRADRWFTAEKRCDGVRHIACPVRLRWLGGPPGARRGPRPPTGAQPSRPAHGAHPPVAPWRVRALAAPLTLSFLSFACGDSSSDPPGDGSTSGSDTGSSSGGPFDPTSSSAAVDDSGSSSTSPGTGTASDTGSSSDDTGSESDTGTTGEPRELELLVCSFVADSVTRYDLQTGVFLGELGPSDDLDGALGITVGPDGDIYVAAEEANMVLRFDGTTGAFVSRMVADDPRTDFDETGGLLGAGAVLFAADGALLVSSFDGDAILRYDGGTGAFLDVFVMPGAGGLNGPDAGMVFGSDGDLYVPSFYGAAVLRYDGERGTALGPFTPPDDALLDGPRTVLFSGAHLLVANEGSDEVLRYDATTGAFVDVFVAAGAGGLDGPAGMVLGPDGILHVASVNGDEVLRFDRSGAPMPTLVDARAGGIAAPTHITLAPALR
jgi:hypothetical protein